MRKIVSLLLSCSLILGVAAPSLAVNTTNERSMEEILKNGKGEEFTLLTEYVDDDPLIRIRNNNVVFSAQLCPDGSVLYAYTYDEGNTLNQGIYPNQLYHPSLENLKSLCVSIVSQLDSLPSDPILFVENEVGNNTPAMTLANTIAQEVTNTFGVDYTNWIMSNRTMTYDRDYYFLCKGTQTTFQLRGESFSFLRDTAVVVISTWLSAKGFECTVSDFLSLASAVVTIVNGVKRLSSSISGNAYYYECDRIKQVSVPYYTGAPVVYSTSQTLKYTFVYSDSTNIWDRTETFNFTQPAYSDENQMYNTALTRFVTNYLLA